MEKLERMHTMDVQKDSPYYTTIRVRNAIDNLLAENAALEASLGKDSTKKELMKIKVKQDRLFGRIKKLDEEFYKIIVNAEERS